MAKTKKSQEKRNIAISQIIEEKGADYWLSLNVSEQEKAITVKKQKLKKLLNLPKAREEGVIWKLK